LQSISARTTFHGNGLTAIDLGDRLVERRELRCGRFVDRGLSSKTVTVAASVSSMSLTTMTPVTTPRGSSETRSGHPSTVVRGGEIRSTDLGSGFDTAPLVLL